MIRTRPGARVAERSPRRPRSGCLTRPKDLPVAEWRWRCSGASGAGGAARTTVHSTRSPSGSGRCRRECAPRPGCEKALRGQWPTVQRAQVDYAQRELAEPQPTTVLGMDETRFGRPRWLPDGSGAQGLIRWRRSDPLHRLRHVTSVTATQDVDIDIAALLIPPT